MEMTYRSSAGEGEVLQEDPSTGVYYPHSQTPTVESKAARRRRILLEELCFILTVAFVLVVLPGWWCIGRRHCYGDSWRSNVNYWKWEEPSFRELLNRSRAEAEPLLATSPHSPNAAEEAFGDLLWPPRGSLAAEGDGKGNQEEPVGGICTVMLTANRPKGFEYVRFTWPLLLKRWGMKRRICRNPSIGGSRTSTSNPDTGSPALNSTLPDSPNPFLPCDRFFIQKTVVRQKPAPASPQRPNHTAFRSRPAIQRPPLRRPSNPTRRLTSVDLGGIDEEQDEEERKDTPPETPASLDTQENSTVSHPLNQTTTKPPPLEPIVPNEAFDEIARFMESIGMDRSSLLSYDPWIDLATGNLSRKKPCPNSAAPWEHRLILSAARAIQHCAQFPNLSAIVILEDDALPTKGVGRKLHAALRQVTRFRHHPGGRNPPPQRQPPNFNLRNGRVPLQTRGFPGSRELPRHFQAADAGATQNQDQDWFMLRAFVTFFFTMEWDAADGISNFLRFQAPFWVGLGLALVYALHARIPVLPRCLRASMALVGQTSSRSTVAALPDSTRKSSVVTVLVWLFHGGRFVSLNELSRVFLACSGATMFFVWVLGKQNLYMWWSMLQVLLQGDQEGVLVKRYEPHSMSVANVFNPIHALAYANFLLTASTTSCSPIDHLQNSFSIDRGLSQYHVVPDLFQHVGFITSASGTKKRSGIWTEHLTSLTWGEG